MHCPLTKAREGAEGRLVCTILLAPSRGCRVTVGRHWAAFTAEEKGRRDMVDDFHVPGVLRQAKEEGRGRVKSNSVWQVAEKRHSWIGMVCKCALTGALGIWVFVKHNSSAP